MANLNVNIPTTFEETVTAPHITGLETPTQPTDAANKQYVDDAVAGGGSGDYLPLAGGTMSGAINMGENAITNVAVPSADTDVSNKQYTDYMKNVFQFSGQTPDGNYNVNFILLYPRFDAYNDGTPSRFLGGALMGRVDRTTSGGGGSALKLTISNIFTDAGFYLRGAPVSGMPTRTQNFSFITSNGAENGSLFFSYNGENPNTNLYVTITHPTAPASCFFNFTLPLGLEIGYKD